MERLVIVVPGRPVPKKVMTRRGKWVGRARQTLGYQEKVAWAARLAGAKVFSGPVVLTVRVYVRDDRRGDLKNYVACVEDGLQYAGVLRNDRQVMRYGDGTGIYYDLDERVEVVVEEVRDLGKYSAQRA